MNLTIIKSFYYIFKKSLKILDKKPQNQNHHMKYTYQMQFADSSLMFGFIYKITHSLDLPPFKCFTKLCSDNESKDLNEGRLCLLYRLKSAFCIKATKKKKSNFLNFIIFQWC